MACLKTEIFESDSSTITDEMFQVRLRSAVSVWRSYLFDCGVVGFFFKKINPLREVPAKSRAFLPISYLTRQMKDKIKTRLNQKAGFFHPTLIYFSSSSGSDINYARVAELADALA